MSYYRRSGPNFKFETTGPRMPASSSSRYPSGSRGQEAREKYMNHLNRSSRRNTNPSTPTRQPRGRTTNDERISSPVDSPHSTFSSSSSSLSGSQIFPIPSSASSASSLSAATPTISATHHHHHHHHHSSSRRRKLGSSSSQLGGSKKAKLQPQVVHVETDDSIRHKTRKLFEDALLEISNASCQKKPKVSHTLSKTKHEDDEEDKKDKGVCSDSSHDHTDLPPINGDHSNRSSKEAKVDWISTKIEQSIFEMLSHDRKSYKHHIRFLIGELRDQRNTQLGQDIMTGTMPIEDFVTSSAEDLACSELKKSRKDMKSKEALKRMYNPHHNSTTSTEFLCPECNCNQTRVESLFSRRDIGKSETWGNKDHASSVDIITCMDCNYKWKMEGS